MKSVKIDAPIVRTFSEYLPEPFVDETSGATYYGYAPLGTTEEEEGWRIIKEIKDETVTKRLYSQGTMDFISAWSKRTEYTYSR